MSRRWYAPPRRQALGTRSALTTPELALDQVARVAVAGSSFLQELSFTDLQRLRKIVHGMYLKYYPPHLQTDHEADRIIEAIGPQVQEAMLKVAIKRRMVE